jgi:pyruvate dehydrogenase E2 component (dihydrolipoamide acetyltransferase)
MATEILMPAVSPSMTEANLVRWHKKEGDPVAAGEIIAEIETDKALVDLEAETDGVLARLLVAAGTAAVKVGAPLGLIARPGETLSAAPGQKPVGAPKPAGTALPPAVVSLVNEAMGSPGAGARVFASPVARRLARLHGVDLALLEGSGPGGRIVRRDVESALEAAPAALPRLAPAALPADAWEEIPHASMRRVIAQRLTESKQQVPHFYLTIDCRMDKLLALRQEINAALPQQKVSVNDFVVKAVAAAMASVPEVNAQWTDTALRRLRSIDVAVAVATPGGLLTPVVRQADGKSLGALSAEIRALAERARQGRLLPHEYQGGGFTVSNLGMHGIREFAAILNPPQACILAVGACERRPVVEEGDRIVAASLMTCTLSVDHRVVDGAVGAAFLGAFKRLLESPLALLVSGGAA